MQATGKASQVLMGAVIGEGSFKSSKPTVYTILFLAMESSKLFN